MFFQAVLGQHAQLSWHTTEKPEVLQLASLTSQWVSKVSYSLVPSFEGNAKDEFGYLLFVETVNSHESVPCSVLVYSTFKCGGA